MTLSDDLFARIDGWNELTTAMARAESFEVDLLRPINTDDLAAQALDHVIRAALDGTPVDLDLLARAGRAKQLEHEQEIQRVAIRRAIESINHQRSTFESAHLDEVLTDLDAELQILVEDVAANRAALNGIRTADEAIKAGAKAVKAWGRVQGWVDRYSEIRSAQTSLINRVGLRGSDPNPPQRWMPTIGYYRDSLQLVDYWAGRRHNAAADSRPDSDAAEAYVAWLRRCPIYDDAISTNATSAAWWPDAERAQFVKRLPDLDPWVPTMTLATQIRQAAMAATTPVRGPLDIQHEEALATYTELIGAADLELPEQTRRRPLIGADVFNHSPRNRDWIAKART